jgi:multiple sugar transport system substrate-binding protein
MNKYAVLVTCTALMTAALSGCGNKESVTPTSPNPAEPNKTADTRPTEPVTVTMYNHFNNISDDRIQQFIIEPLKKQLPNVTFEVVKHQNGSKLEELVAAGNFTDLYYGSNVGFPSYLNVELQYDMKDLMKKHNIDTSRFEPWSLDAIKMYGEKGEVFGVPFSANYASMIYNKDIFDRLGVPYPKDGMTWEEVVELSRKLTRMDNGVQYIGLEPGKPTDMASGLSLSYVDEKANKSVMSSSDWRRVFNIFKEAYSVPGYVQSGKFDYGTNGFLKDKTVAMMPIWSLQILNFQKELEGMNWDIVSYPTFKEQPERGREVDIHMLAISNVSKNKDAAMEVLKVITSDEVQMLMSQYGTASVLKKDDIKKSYGSKLPQYQGKNVQALFKTKPGIPHVISKKDGVVRTFVDGARKDIAAAGKDINTVLREMEEQSNQKLAETK